MDGRQTRRPWRAVGKSGADLSREVHPVKKNILPCNFFSNASLARGFGMLAKDREGRGCEFLGVSERGGHISVVAMVGWNCDGSARA